MPLGTLDRTPPPFFRQGPSALTKVVFFSAFAVFLMVADTRLQLTQPLRAALATVLHPIEVTLRTPVKAFGRAADYWAGMDRALAAEAQARVQLANQSDRTAQLERLLAENDRLRALLAMRPSIETRSRPAEVLFEAADPYSRRVVIDIGSNRGVVAGSPVINEAGVVGQVTRVYPLSAEVTLLNDKDAAIPVLNARSQQRGVAFGSPASGGLEMRFMAGSADVRPGDRRVTSGLDGVYPAGLAVATVERVDRRAETGFARIELSPVTTLDTVRHVLVLEPMKQQMPAREQGAAPAGATSNAPPNPAANPPAAVPSAPFDAASGPASAASLPGRGRR
jgi:rod shape-determining protein MreC